MNENRKIYLIRHGSPYRTGERARCLGGTDIPLSDVGVRQARRLGKWAASAGIRAVYSSPLMRCRQTAQAIADGAGIPSVTVADGLREIDAGLWDGLTFDEIRARWPEEYRRRGEDMANFPIPGGESFAMAGARFKCCMDGIIGDLTADTAVVAHAGVIRAYLSMLQGRPLDDVTSIRQPFGGISTLEIEDGTVRVKGTGEKPEPFLDADAMEEMFAHFATPEGVRAHMRAVADYLGGLLDRLPGEYDRHRLITAALIHDIARTEKRHPDVAADYLEKEGFSEIAHLVREHQSDTPTGEETLSEADLLFYADKRVLGRTTVTVAERYAAGRARCTTREALEKNRELERKTICIENKLRRVIGADVDF